MTRRVVALPREIERRLNNFTALELEVNGVIFYQPREELCPLETLFVMGIGTEEQVRSSPERLQVANEFLRINPQYHYVEFHTHSEGTIGRYGDYYAGHFSNGDFATMKSKLRDDQRYIHLLATPRMKFIFGVDNPELVVLNDFPGYRERSLEVNRAINEIARRKNYDFSKLEVTRG